MTAELILHTAVTVGSLSNHDDDGGNNNLIHLHIFPALHLRF